ncbi:transport and Golgi organization protein 6 homolog [Amphibalanus amphitrite]|uniref:transport and Golgi organization protein 6 homolog n=1 Tax=Amphibalanus amphitrite TaxID=1232801 RepID=UPI001C92062F|nr:transport and Golgi organization protein 6 homolog [Amphibalanus amphitrite]
MTPERRQQLLRQRRQLEPQLAPLLGRLPASGAVRELLLLQRCAATSKPPRRWLHERTAWWVFQYVRRPGGLAAVTEGLLQFWGQDRLDDVPLERIQAVATLLCAPLPEFKDEQYFTHLASEVLSLLRLPRQEARVTVLRVAGALSAALWATPLGRPAVEAALLRPLLDPLSAERPEPAAEAELSGAVTALWQLVVVGSEPDSPCLEALVPYAGALLRLHAVVGSSVSQLRAPCRELLLRLLSAGRLGGAPQTVELLLLSDGVGEARRFALGETGGARVEPVPAEEADNWLLEDDVLAAAFSGLLAEAAAQQLVADVFVTLLERMRAVAALDGLAEEAPPPLSSAETLLAWERRHAERRRQFRHGLLTLRALAALTDCERARAGLEDAARLVPVVQTLLEGFEAGGGEPGLLQVETVCLALGVLGGLLGSEPSTAPCWAGARRLEPVLQRLAGTEGGSERVRDMAADLRTLILTNGAVRPEDLVTRPPQSRPTDDRVKADPDRKPGPGQMPDQRTSGQTPPEDQWIKPDPDGQVDSKPDQRRTPLITVLDSRDNTDQTDAAPDSAVKLESPLEPTPTAQRRLKPSTDVGSDASSPPVPGETGTASGVTHTDPAAVSKDLASAIVRDNPPCGPSDPACGPSEPACGPSDPARGPSDPPTYQQAMYELVDPLLPVRAHALLSLSRLLERGDPETCSHREQLLGVFQDKLDDDDSYVYLAAVRGLACLADRYTTQVVPELCRQFTDRARHQDTETRLKLAEALVLVVRNLGDLAPHHSPPLLAALLAGCRDPEPLVRASSLSCLAEVCRLLRFSLAAHLHEVFGCLSALVDTDPAVEVRRAAVLVVAQLIEGLGADALKVLEDVLLPLYRRLKVLLRREEDPALLHHVQTALDGLESATRQMLFPPAPRTLQKRILVLDPPS